MAKSFGTYATGMVAACLMAACIALPACSGSGSTSASASSASAAASSTTTSSASASASASTSSAASSVNSQSASQAQEDAARQAEKERLQRLEQAYKATVEAKDLWADELVVDSLNKLADSGAIASLPEDFQLFEKVFEFKPIEDGYAIDFLDAQAETELTGDFALDLSDGKKVAICREEHMLDPTTYERLRDVGVLSTDKDNAFSTAVVKHDEKLLATPTLKPSGYFDMIDPAVSDDVFADNLDECSYLLAYGQCYSNIVENYYAISPTAKGTIDRIDVTTIVLVIDVQERSIVHVEVIGTDVPKGGGDAAKLDNYGKQFTKEANAYISSLLMG